MAAAAAARKLRGSGYASSHASGSFVYYYSHRVYDENKNEIEIITETVTYLVIMLMEQHHRSGFPVSHFLNI